MAGEHILVVDDTAMNVKLLEVLLRAKGYRVTSATTGEQALELIGREQFTLILLDLRLPGMDGLALARLLRARPTFGKTPIIAVTAHAMKGDEEEALAAGCDAYVSKPIDTRAFPDIVASVLAKTRA